MRSDFAFYVGPHKVTGWVGLLAHGKGSSMAGFNIFRRGRLIMPNHKFIGPGLYPEVTTNVIHKRLTGAIDLDSVPVVHLKNGIDFRNFQDEFEQRLAGAIQQMRGRAIALRYLAHLDVADSNDHLPSQAPPLPEANCVRVIETGDMQSTIMREVKALAFRGETVRVFFAPLPQSEAYVRYHRGTGSTCVMINTLHPRFSDVSDVEYEAYVAESINDVLAHIVSKESNEDWLLAKDEILRQRHSCEKAESEIDQTA